MFALGALGTACGVVAKVNDARKFLKSCTEIPFDGFML
jgi:hypothetical protein